LAAALPGTVAANCCFCDNVSVASFGATLTDPETTVTVALVDLLTPAPVQLNM
jgi:hypothetical protein